MTYWMTKDDKDAQYTSNESLRDFFQSVFNLIGLILKEMLSVTDSNGSGYFSLLDWSLKW